MFKINADAINLRGNIADNIKKRYKSKFVEVGVPANSGSYEDGNSTVSVAVIQEFGLPSKNIPERPFLRTGVRLAKKSISKAIEQAVKNAKTNPEAMDSVLNTIGILAVNSIRQSIEDRIYEANQESTIKKKGSDTPLVDTGHLRQSIIWRVGNNEEK